VRDAPKRTGGEIDDLLSRKNPAGESGVLNEEKPVRQARREMGHGKRDWVDSATPVAKRVNVIAQARRLSL
jgi:hypothetical protein